MRGGYDVEKNATAYESTTVPLRMNRANTPGLQGRQLITLSALAACMGRDCIPGEVVLVLANDGDNETLLNYETMMLTADGQSYLFEDLLDREEAVRVPPGEFVRVPMPREAFERLAQAQEVVGTLGGAPFRLDYDDRAPFRALMLQLGTARTDTE